MVKNGRRYHGNKKNVKKNQNFKSFVIRGKVLKVYVNVGSGAPRYQQYLEFSKWLPLPWKLDKSLTLTLWENAFQLHFLEKYNNNSTKIVIRSTVHMVTCNAVLLTCTRICQNKKYVCFFSIQNRALKRKSPPREGETLRVHMTDISALALKYISVNDTPAKLYTLAEINR